MVPPLHPHLITIQEQDGTPSPKIHFLLHHTLFAVSLEWKEAFNLKWWKLQDTAEGLIIIPDVFFHPCL